MEEKPTMSNEQRRLLNTRKVTVEISLLEEELIKQLREVKHGKFIIQMLDGVPFRYQIEISKFFTGSQDVV